MMPAISVCRPILSSGIDIYGLGFPHFTATFVLTFLHGYTFTAFLDRALLLNLLLLLSCLTAIFLRRYLIQLARHWIAVSTDVHDCLLHGICIALSNYVIALVIWPAMNSKCWIRSLYRQDTNYYLRIIPCADNKYDGHWNQGEWVSRAVFICLGRGDTVRFQSIMEFSANHAKSLHHPAKPQSS